MQLKLQNYLIPRRKISLGCRSPAGTSCLLCQKRPCSDYRSWLLTLQHNGTAVETWVQSWTLVVPGWSLHFFPWNYGFHLGASVSSTEIVLRDIIVMCESVINGQCGLWRPKGRVYSVSFNQSILKWKILRHVTMKYKTNFMKDNL